MNPRNAFGTPGKTAFAVVLLIHLVCVDASVQEFDPLVRSGIEQEITNEFAAAKRLSQLQVTAASTEMVMNGSSVDEGSLRKLLFSEIESVKSTHVYDDNSSTFIFGIMSAWSDDLNDPDSNCTSFQFQNYNKYLAAYTGGGYTWTPAAPGSCSEFDAYNASAPTQSTEVYEGKPYVNPGFTDPSSGCMKYYSCDEYGRPVTLVGYNNYVPCKRGWFTNAAAGPEEGNWFGPFTYSEGPYFGMGFGMPMKTRGFEGGDKVAGVAAVFIILADIETYLVETLNEYDGLMAYIVDDTDGYMIAASKEGVATVLDESANKLVSIPASNASVADIRAAEEFFNTTMGQAGRYNGTVYVLDLPTSNVSWVQSKTIEMDFAITGAKTGTSSDATINWRLVVVQGISCPGGYVVDVAGENLPSLTTNGGGCVACNPGYSSKGGDQTLCEECAAGTHAQQAGASSCVECDAGYFASERGLSVCEKCEASKHLDSVAGSSACTICIPEYYTTTPTNASDPQTTTCLPCPVDEADGTAIAKCKGGSTLPWPKKNYWHLLDETWAERVDIPEFPEVGGKDMEYRRQGKSMTVMACPAPKNCIGPAEEGTALYAMQKSCLSSVNNMTNCGDVFCKKGSTGRLCAMCEKGADIASTYYAGEDGECLKCEGSLATLIWVGIIASAIFLVCVFLAVKYSNFFYNLLPAFLLTLFDPGKMKVIVSMMQIIGSISWTTGVKWPDPFGFLARAMSVFQLSFVDTVPVVCVVGYRFIWNEILISTLGPIVVVAAAAAVRIYSQRKLDLFIANRDDYMSRRPHGVKHNQRIEDEMKQLKESAKFWRVQVVYFTLLVMYFVLPTTSLTITRTYICQEFDDGRSFLGAELDEECFTKRHHAAMIYSGIMVLVYPVGIPLTFLVVLWQKRDQLYPSKEKFDGWRTPGRDGLVKLSEELAPYKILFGEYRSARYMAEVFECFRRIALCCVVAVADVEDPVVRSFVGLAISFFFSLFQNAWRPFQRPSTNGLAISANWITFFMFLTAFMILSEPFAFDETAISVTLTVVSVAILVFATFNSLKKANKKVSALRLQQKVKGFQDRVRDIVAAQSSLFIEDAHIILAKDVDYYRRPLASLAAKADADALALGDDGGGGDGGDGGDGSFGLGVGGIQLTDLTRRLSFGDQTQDAPEPVVEWVCVVDGKDVPFGQVLQKELENKFKIYKTNSSGFFTQKKTEVRFEARNFQYVIDWDSMEQVNVQTGGRRTIKRKETNKDKKQRRPSGLSPTAAAAVVRDVVAYAATATLGDDDGDDQNDARKTKAKAKAKAKEDKKKEKESRAKRKQREADLHPMFPAELEPRVLLLLDEGQLLQVSRIKTVNEVDWCYGIVIKEGDGAADDVHQQDLDNKEQLEYNGCELHKDSGWFPASYTAAPTTEQMLEYQDQKQGGSASATGVLAPPLYWRAAQKAKEDEVVGAQLYDVDPTSEEYDKVAKAYNDGKHGYRANNTNMLADTRVTRIQRIENMNLWQSYAAKLNSMKVRAKKETPEPDSSKYEQMYYFHGTAPHLVYELEYQQGFNRSFAGKNACFYGRGCYFARDSAYSIDYSGLMPGGVEKKGPYQMLACRVAVGEFCQGVKDAIVPAVRLEETKTLYDSTVKSMKEKDPKQMFVTYHDAQAYPEYLVTFVFEE